MIVCDLDLRGARTNVSYFMCHTEEGSIIYFSGGGKIGKTVPNIPAHYPSSPFKPALKPILERFDFVKSSGFSKVCAPP